MTRTGSFESLTFIPQQPLDLAGILILPAGVDPPEHYGGAYPIHASPGSPLPDGRRGDEFS